MTSDVYAGILSNVTGTFTLKLSGGFPDADDGDLSNRGDAARYLSIQTVLAACSPEVWSCNMSNTRSALAAAKSSSFLTGLEQPALQAVVGAAQIRRISAKHTVTSAGHRATHLFLVQSGQLRYYHLTKKGEVVLLALLVPGDVIGLVALLKAPSAYMASAEATSDCELLVWDRTVIRKLVSRHPVLGENGMQIALGYLRNYVRRHIGLVTKTAEERLAETLLKLGDQAGAVHPDGIEIHATNDQLGALADISPFTVSRVLGNWARAGTLSKGRGRVLVHAPEALMID
jgi:CRP-like cAMP-binding protein